MRVVGAEDATRRFLVVFTDPVLIVANLGTTTVPTNVP